MDISKQMEIKTRQLVADKAIQHYLNCWGDHPSCQENAKRVRRGRKKLGSHPDPDAVDALIGTDGWTKTECFCCGKEKDATVTITRDEICKECLEKALKLINKALKIVEKQRNEPRTV